MRGFLEKDRIWILDDKGFSRGLFSVKDLGLGIAPADIIVYREGEEAVAIKTDTREVIAHGTDHAEVIQKAIDYVASKGGGTIHITKGTYIITTKDIGLPYKVGIHIIEKAGIRIVGDGEGNTVLKLADGVGGTVIYYKNAHWLEIRDLTIDGNKDNNTDSGIDGDLAGIKGHTTYFAKIVNVELRNCVRQGFYPTNCSWSHYENIYAHHNGYEGIVLDSEDLSTVINLKTGTNGLIDTSRAGLYIVGGATREPSYVTVVGGIHYNNPINVKIYNAIGVELYGVKAYYSRKDIDLDGIWVQNSKDVKLISCEAVGNARGGILVVDSENVHIIGCLSRNNGQYGSGVDRAGIILTYLYGNVRNIYISDCQLYDDQDTKTQLFAIRVNDPAHIDNVVVERSVMEPNADSRLVYELDLTKMKIIRCRGLTTSNSGVATIPAGSTRVTVSHGLVKAPRIILLTPAGNARVWYENVTDTSFDIVTDTAPSTDLDVTWYAEV
ncbi:MAG: right-handed parallel beta-helix repeat-containing protein [Candidatus Omnitrophica bacterium]|nr:right-handed parallel beta-helix repeat-containing protein [Candidatus Omnitrophota bacterium]